MHGYPCHAPFGQVQICSWQICHAWLSLKCPFKPIGIDISYIAVIPAGIAGIQAPWMDLSLPSMALDPATAPALLYLLHPCSRPAPGGYDELAYNLSCMSYLFQPEIKIGIAQ